MDCTLMHKNIPVVELVISEYSGSIEKHGIIHNPAHLPLGTTVTAGKDMGKIIPRNLNEWWTGRSIPASRDGLRDAMEILGFQNMALLLAKCYGLSLSDQYWVCPKGSGLRWEMINFFQNDFSKDVGEILFGQELKEPDRVSLMSPDNTSDGWLRKKWIVIQGKRYLMKGGSGFVEQEPYNEVVASALMRRLKITHIPYTLIIEKGKPYSLCENFITPDTELVPAWRVIESYKKDNQDSYLTHLLRCVDRLGMPDVRPALEKMLVLDYLISNEDRHYNNFGFIRNPETLEWLGLAPVYDNGTSLWYNTPHVGSVTECKPFRKTHAEQIKLVEDYSWFNYDALKGLKEEIIEAFAPSDRVDENRRTAIAKAVIKQIADIQGRIKN